jgi:hypothetical protein
MEKGDMAGAESPALVVVTSGVVWVPVSEESPSEELDVVAGVMMLGSVDTGEDPVTLAGRDGAEDEEDGTIIVEVGADDVDMTDGGGEDRSGGCGGALGLGQARL